ncbi:MAG TPA: hypothetical protein PLQ93_02250 [Bacteroidia bacterium]|nr:hypothetical protein [Bacteroidia bacterium]
MKFPGLIGFCSLVVLIANTGCKDKLELNAPYKEIPSIYAVLNPDDNIQMIRINKVFLGEGDANQMAQVADSINYPEGQLEVTLTDSKGNVNLFHDSLVKTAEGAFNPNQRVYVSSAKLKTREPYLLTVKNLHTGNVFTARDTSLAPLSILNTYRPFVPIYYPVPPGSAANDDNYIDYSGQNTSYTIRYSPNEAKLYQFVIRLHYYDSLGNGNRIDRALDYPFNNLYQKDINIGGPNNGFLLNVFKGKDLFNAAGLALSKSTAVSGLLGRKMYKIQFFIYTSTQEYLDYLEYAKPSLNISQTKPIYSNFDKRAAMGIFSFRTSVTVEKSISNTFISEFAYNPATCQYQFYTASLSKPGCR